MGREIIARSFITQLKKQRTSKPKCIWLVFLFLSTVTFWNSVLSWWDTLSIIIHKKCKFIHTYKNKFDFLLTWFTNTISCIEYYTLHTKNRFLKVKKIIKHTWRSNRQKIINRLIPLVKVAEGNRCDKPLGNDRIVSSYVHTSCHRQYSFAHQSPCSCTRNNTYKLWTVYNVTYLQNIHNMLVLILLHH